MNLKWLWLFLISIPFSYSQNISSTIYDLQSGNTIDKASIKTTSTTVFSDKNGFFLIKKDKNTKTLIISKEGYQDQVITIADSSDTISPKVIYLSPIISISEITLLAKKRENPLALKTIKKATINKQLGNRDLPEILKQNTSSYVSKSGYGDVKTYIRGFSQSNVAVLINGVPVNDLETGEVYWSNWTDLGEITSVIQTQKGLGDAKITVPAVGGSINIITSSSSKKQGGSIKLITSSEGYFKKTIGYNTGKSKNGLAASILLSHFYGNGYIDATAAKGYSYYFNIDYDIAKKHQLNFNIIGSPQEHEQHNIASTITKYLKYGDGNTPNIKYNSEWGFLNGKPFTWSKNFFHKPITSINWNWRINTTTKLNSVFYGAWGKGGGTAAVGAINFLYPANENFYNENGQIRFDDIYAWNTGATVSDFGSTRTAINNGLYINNINDGLTRYAFINNHAWYGSIINIKHIFNANFKLNAGIDLRTAQGKSGLAVNNTLGADAYLDFFNENNPNNTIYPKDYLTASSSFNPLKSIDNLQKIIFYTQSKTKWTSLYARLNYNYKTLKSFLQLNISKKAYQRENFFELNSKSSPWISKTGGNIKLGINYNINNNHHLFSNYGIFSKQPSYEAVFANYSNNIIDSNLSNELINNAEIGYGYKNNHFTLDICAYYTNWKDRFSTISSYVNGQQITGKLFGLSEIHQGIELESKYFKNKISIGANLSIGNWEYANNLKNIKLYNSLQQEIAIRDYNLKNIKVGNSPQLTANYNIAYKINSKLEIGLQQLFNSNMYGNINLNNTNSNIENLKLPSYSLLNLQGNYQTKIKKIGTIRFNINVNNLLNTKYINESKTSILNTSSNQTWKGINAENEVFFGWGRTASISIALQF